jgi:hypothetical protein
MARFHSSGNFYLRRANLLLGRKSFQTPNNFNIFVSATENNPNPKKNRPKSSIKKSSIKKNPNLKKTNKILILKKPTKILKNQPRSSS